MPNEKITIEEVKQRPRRAKKRTAAQRKEKNARRKATNKLLAARSPKFRQPQGFNTSRGPRPSMDSNTTRQRSSQLTSSIAKIQRTVERDAGRIIASFADPRNHRPVQLPTDWSDLLTGVSSPYVLLRPDIDASESSNVTSFFAAISPQLERALIYGLENASQQPYEYDAQFALNDGSGSFSLAQTIGSSVLSDISIEQNEFPLTPVSFVAATSYAPHGQNLWCGTAPNSTKPGFRWFFANQTDMITVTALTLTSTFTIEVFLYQWVNGNATIVDQQTFDADHTSFDMQANAPGYYSVSIKRSALGAIADISLVLQSNPTTVLKYLVSHSSMPTFDENILSWLDRRFLGNSLRFEQDSSQLNNGGQVIMGQTDAKFDISSILTQENNDFDFTDVISKLPNSRPSMDIKNGAYMFVKPASECDVHWQSSIRFQNGIPIDSSFDITRSTFAIMQVNFLQPIYKAYVIENAVNIEFQTLNVAWPTSKVRTAKRSFEMCAEIMRDIPQFTENPTHARQIISSIGKGLMKAIGFIGRYGGQAASIAKMIGEL